MHLGAKVNADDVAAFQNALLARNAMNDLVIDGNAGCGGEVIQMQKVRFRTLTFDILISDPVDLPGGDARPNRFPGHTKCSG